MKLINVLLPEPFEYPADLADQKITNPDVPTPGILSRIKAVLMETTSDSAH